jgi:hypothetical protein
MSSMMSKTASEALSLDSKRIRKKERQRQTDRERQRERDREREEKETETKEIIKFWPKNTAVKTRGKPQHDVEDGLNSAWKRKREREKQRKRKKEKEKERGR